MLSVLRRGRRAFSLSLRGFSSVPEGNSHSSRWKVDQQQRQKRVFIGNLSQRTSEDELHSHMRPAGEIVSVKIMRKADGTSKRCALVEFRSQDSVQRALSELNMSTLSRRILVIRPDFLDKTERRHYDRGVDMKGVSFVHSTKSDGMKDNVAQENDLHNIIRRSQSVFIGSLPKDLDVRKLREHFERVGYEVVSAQIFMTRDSPPLSKCCGKIVFSEETNILNVINRMNRTEIGGRKILVKEDEGKHFDNHSPNKNEENNIAKRDHKKMFLTRGVHWNTEEKSIEIFSLDENDDDINPSRSIYVSNLAYSVTHKRLVQFLVNDMIMSDKRMEAAVLQLTKVRLLLDSVGQSRGRAFVEFDHEINALETLDRISQSTLQGRHVFARMMNIM